MSETTHPTTDAQPPAEDATSAGVPNYAELGGSGSANPAGQVPIERFAGVPVAITAELGRVSMSLQELMNLTDGQVIELNRSISAPIELVAQGVPIGNGEVVVVDDQFAIRVKELYQSPKS